MNVIIDINECKRESACSLLPDFPIFSMCLCPKQLRVSYMNR